MDMHKFRTQLLVTTAILALSGAAYAADMPVKAPPPPMAPAVIPWTGFYAGLQIGGASYEPSCHSSATGPFDFEGATLADRGLDPCFTRGANLGEFPQSGSLSSASVIGGGKVGYDWQWGWAVLGVVGDFDWTHLSGTSQIFDTFDPGSALSASDRINWIASARGRIGWTFGALDNFLVYATGGVAWANIKASTSGIFADGDVLFSGQTSSTKTGAVAGAGMEYRVTPHVSVVGEVLWYGFGSTTVNAPVNPAFTCCGEVYTTQFNHQDVVSGTLGVNYRF
jgi:outer membrane immunogenic protein